MSLRSVASRADLLLLLVAAAWGTSYGLAKEAVSLYPVLGFLVIRFGLTTLFLSGSLILQWRCDATYLFKSGVTTGLILMIIFLCETYGVMHTSASNAAVLISLCVVMTPFAEWAILGQAPGARIWFIVVLSLLGVMAISEGFSYRFSLGDGLILCAAVMRALMVTLTSKLTRNYNGSSAALTAVQSLVVTAGCGLLVIVLIPDKIIDVPVSPRFWAIMFYLVVVCTVLAFFVQNYAVRRVSPTRVSVLMGSEPLFGVLFAVYWLGESLTPRGMLGMGLIVIAGLLMVLTRNVREKAADNDLPHERVESFSQEKMVS
ncbi:MAG: DMT family transporter [Granulosicoccus sp.]